MRLTPLLVARSQLLTAIDLFVADSDPVSVQALAGNARELLESLCRLGGVEPMTELFSRDHPGKPKRDIYAAMNLYRNVFKHLGDTEGQRADDQLTLNQFDDSKNDYLLYVAIEDYIRLRKAMPVPMQIFHAWFIASHAHLLDKVFPKQKFLGLFPGLDQLTRLQQKRGLAACIERYSTDPHLLGDPATEPISIDN
jgi:hypothetical protein